MDPLKAIQMVIRGALVSLALLSFPTYAQLLTLNFDTDFSGNAISAGQGINDAYGPQLHASFIGGVIQHTGGGLSSLPNWASSFNAHNGITVIFDNPTSFVSVTNVSFSSFTLSAFDSNDILLGSGSVSSTFFDGAKVELSFSGISRLMFVDQGTGYGFDDFVFQVASLPVSTPPPVSPIPEPETYAMLLAGLALLGWHARRRKLRAAAFT